MIPSQGDEHPCPEDDHQLQLAYFYREPQISDFWFLMLKIPECCDVQIRLGLTIWCWHHVIFIFFSYFSHIFPWWVPYFPMVFFRVFHNDRGPGALVLLPTRELASQARLTGLTAVFFDHCKIWKPHPTWMDNMDWWSTLSDKWDGLTVNTSGNHHTA